MRSLPGFEGNLSTKHWSGYISVPLPHGSTAHVHYWLVENDAKVSSKFSIYRRHDLPLLERTCDIGVLITENALLSPQRTRALRRLCGNRVDLVDHLSSGF